MKKPFSLLSLGSVLLIIIVLFIVITDATPSIAGEPAGNKSILGQKATDTPKPPPGQTPTATPVNQDYMPVIMAMNITPTATSLPPAQGPTDTPRPSPR